MVVFRRLLRRRLGALLALITAAMLAGAWSLRSRAGVAINSEHAALAHAGIASFGHVDAEGGVASLYPAQPGRIERIAVQEGQQVTAGTVLLVLDSKSAECLVRQAEAALQASRARLEEGRNLIPRQTIREAEQQAVIDAVQNRLKAAELVLARKEDLRGREVNDKEIAATRAGVEELHARLRGQTQRLAELRLNDPRATVRRSEADVAARQARFEQAQLALREYMLRAPADGTILRIFVHPGELLGSQPRQPAISFCPKGARIVRAEVEQEFAAQIALNQAAIIQDDSGTGPVWHGRIATISDWFTLRRSILQEPLQFNDVRTLECLIRLDDGAPALRIGQRVRVMIQPSGS